MDTKKHHLIHFRLSIISIVVFVFYLLEGCCSQKNSQVIVPLCPMSEEITEKPLLIEGEIPSWLQGTFVRNGPVSVQISNEQTCPHPQKQCHWFDGLAMLHAFSFQCGKVTYSNKYLKTDPYNTVFMNGNLNFLGFDSLPKHPILYRIKAFFRPKNYPPLQNANVNVAKVANEYVAFTETPLPVSFDLKTAETLGALQFLDNLPKEFIFDSAHPKVDGKTGEQFNYLVDYGFLSKYVIYRYSPCKPYRECIGKIPVDKPAYMHSFALTKNYIILVEFPLVVNPFNIIFMTVPFIQNYYWDPKRGTNFVIIDRNTGELIQKLNIEQGFFAFHHVNAFEEKNNIILDIVTYEDASIIPDIAQHGYLSRHFLNEKLPTSELVRYVLPLASYCEKNATANSNQNYSDGRETIKRKVLFKGALELPRINEKYLGYSYRYIYGSDQRVLTRPEDIRSIYKIDTKTGQHQFWQERGVLPGEAVFIPRPNANEEDDGVIVNIVLDRIQEKAFLLILDGKSFQELGRVYTPFTIPIGLHGQFF